jgi:Zn-dependent protease with chaperone function
MNSVEPIRGRWFDGRTSGAKPVLVSLRPTGRGPALRLHELSTGGQTLEFDAAEIGWPPTWSASRAPPKLVIDLHRQGSIEIEDAAAWQAALQSAGERAPLAQRMQTRWPVFLAVLAIAAAALGAFYRWGTPWAATQVTRQVPLDWETALSRRALRDLDRSLLKPSKLSAQRQAQLRARFDALARQVEPGLHRYRGYAPALSLSFRSGLGANAFALPGGAVVITDGMVAAAERQGVGDDALVGVLAHEIGHVIHRHTTRMLVEQAVLNVGLGLAVGDVSSLLSVGGSLLTGLSYRRSHESEADCFAVALMEKAGLPTAAMADLLLGIEAEHAQQEKGKAPVDEPSFMESLLSTHPETGLRALQLRQGRLEGCQRGA